MMANSEQHLNSSAPNPRFNGDASRDDARLLFVLALERACARAYEQATPLLQAVITCYPDSEWVDDAHMVLGLSYLYSGVDDKAVKAFRTVANDLGDSEYAAAAQQQAAYLEDGRYL